MPNAAQVTVDFDGIVAALDQRLIRAQRCAFLTIAAVSRLEDSPDVRPMLGVSFPVSIGDAAESTVALRADATDFVVGCALREAIDGLALLCEELWRVAAVFRAASVDGELELKRDLDLAAMDLTSFGDSVLGPRKAIDSAGFAAKLTMLEVEFGVKTELREEAESINKARTCLTHRLGRVGAKDINDGANQRLRVKYRATEIWCVQPDGVEKVVEPGLVVEAGGSLRVRTARRELAFGLGEHVAIGAQEFMHMMSTLLLAGRQLVRSCSESVRACSRGTFTDEVTASQSPPAGQVV